MAVFKQIFVQREYSSVADLQNVFVIMDLGANVGYSSAYFLNCFPQSRVLAVEPDDRNLEVCRQNLRPYAERAVILPGAAWSYCTALSLSCGSFRDGREWATQVVPRQEHDNRPEVQGWDIPTLIEASGSSEVDLLKVDIEGAERQLFSENAESWLPKVRNICIELHGAECRTVFFACLAGWEYDLSYSGDLTICRNLRRRGH
jgi:FkbM family methyltransferase